MESGRLEAAIQSRLERLPDRNHYRGLNFDSPLTMVGNRPHKALAVFADSLEEAAEGQQGYHQGDDGGFQFVV